MDQALAGQNASQPVREEWLDPTELHPVHQALVDQVSKQRGPRVHRLSPFMERAKAGMDSRAILFDSYDRKTKAAEAEVAMTLDPTLQYAAQGLPSPAELIGAGMGVQPPDAPAGGPAGVQPPDAPTVQTVTPSAMPNAQFDRLSGRMDAHDAARPVYPGAAPLEDPTLLSVVGSAIAAYLTKNPRLATLPLEAGIYDQQRRTKEGQLQFAAQTGAHEDAGQALERLLVLQNQRDINDANRADAAGQFNAREANDYEIAVRGQDIGRQNTLTRAESALSRLQMTLAQKDNAEGAKIAAEFKARREILKTAHRDWTDEMLDEAAAAYVNAKPELTVQQGAKAKHEATYLQRTLNDRIDEAHQKVVNAKLQGAYIKARTKYTEELTRFLPQAEAFRWASLLALMDYRDRSLGLREEENDAGLDETAVKTARKAYEAAMEDFETYESMLKHRIDADGNAIQVGSGDVDYNTGAVQGDDETAAKIRRKMYFYKTAAMRAEQTLDKATRDAQAAQGRSQERRKGQTVFRLPSLPGFFPGKRGEKPLDPTGGAFERPPGEPLKLGGSVNPYDGLV